MFTQLHYWNASNNNYNGFEWMLYLLSFNPTFEWSLNSVALALGAFFLLRTVAIRPVPSIHLRFCSSFGANLHLLWLPLRWGMSLSSVRWSDIDKKDSFIKFTMIYFKLTLFGTNDRTTGSANLLLSAFNWKSEWTKLDEMRKLGNVAVD